MSENDLRLIDEQIKEAERLMRFHEAEQKVQGAWLEELRADRDALVRAVKVSHRLNHRDHAEGQCP